MRKTELSIITVGMNHLKFLENFYHSLFRDPGVRPGVTFEAIYVDNCSTDKSVEFIKKNYPSVKIIQNKKIHGFGENNNRGVDLASADYIAIINPDIILQKNSIENILDFLESNTDVGIVVPQLLNTDYTVQFSVRNFATPKALLNRILSRGHDDSTNDSVSNYLCKYIDFEKTQPINWAFGAALFMSRLTYEYLGGFDADYFLYMEDEDLCLRAWKNGLPVIYLPASKMIHNHLRASSKIGMKSLIHFKSLIIFYIKHGFKFVDYSNLNWTVQYNKNRTLIYDLSEKRVI